MKLKSFLSENASKSLEDFDINTFIGLSGNLICYSIGITSLKGCNPTVKSGFDCSSNKLTSLEYGPKTVGKYYFCYDNSLTTLEGAPTYIPDSFSCADNKLTSLKHCPAIFNSLICSNNYLTSLEYAPKVLRDSVVCSKNDIKSLIGVDDIFDKICGTMDITENPIRECGLGLLLIEDLQYCDHDSQAIGIINDFLRYENAPSLIYDCQQKLIENGYEAYAQI